MKNVIYIGATNNKLGLQQFTIYKERPTTLIETLKEKFPAINKLFVAVDDFIEVEKELYSPESPIYSLSKKIREVK